tara:strand:+ start:137 stop:1330 length:1194 start_codon:yes stop_codon:yes gene_type:complete
MSANTTRKRNTRNSLKKKGGIEFYPYHLIGKGAYKDVFNVTTDIDAKSIIRPILTSEEREKMSVTINENDGKNMVMVRPQNTVNSNNVSKFREEMMLQSRFSELGLAPKVLKINTELKNNKGYTPYAYTNRCYFDICEYKFKTIQKNLKALFDAVANEGYIYTDIKQGNICILNEGSKRTKNPKFVFVDFDQDYIYPYKGVKVTNSGNEPNVDIQEIVSDIMEFMFIIIELRYCGERLNCLFCNNLTDMTERLLQIKKKYDNFNLNTYPMISKNGNNLLELLGADIPRVTPVELLVAYIGMEVDDYESTLLYHSVTKTMSTILNTDINTKSKSKSSSKSKTRSKSKSKSPSNSKTRSKSKSPPKPAKKYTPNPIDSPSATEMTPSKAMMYAWKTRKN